MRFSRQAFRVELLPLRERTSEQLRKVQGGAGHLGRAGRLLGSDADTADDGCLRRRDKSQEEAEGRRETQADPIAPEGRVAAGRQLKRPERRRFSSRTAKSTFEAYRLALILTSRQMIRLIKIEKKRRRGL